MAVFLLQLVAWFFKLYSLAFIVRVLLSWLNVSLDHHPVTRFVFQITEPVLAPLRRYILPQGGLDFTPMVALLILWLVEQLLTSILLLFYRGG
ncbi:MAG: YggT family protein [Chloroflexi bacterium]|nr:YggT family protein [Chloroflexota bacterium]